MWFETNSKASQMDQYFSVDCPFKSCSISVSHCVWSRPFQGCLGGRAGGQGWLLIDSMLTGAGAVIT